MPAGQSSHLLWHTFASRFVMNGEKILTLQKILGHTTPAMALRYTHLAPDHLQDVEAEFAARRAKALSR
ncbi:tyrosine-type recombinase/integrase [Pseudomonas sp. BMW13]|uniref:tyrosine-type recombinase/integrase n=1 Tax=Pseudomonas sp. BMW13 TaxID=2562590 RepID=UPI0035A34445